jgi:DNA modification methylase
MRNTNYTPNYFSCEGLTAKRQQANPFAKPFEICEWILDKVAFTGQTCLDPYAGEGSICKAEIIKGLVPTGIELMDNHYDRLCNHMREQYKKLAGDQVTFS